MIAENMTTTIEKEFGALTVAERVDLVESLWEQIASRPSDLPTAALQIKEVERRSELYKEHPDRAVPWPEVKARIIKRHAKRRRSS